MYHAARSWATAALLIVAASACGSESRTGESSGPGSARSTAAQVAAEDYDSSRFGDSAKIDHRWYPLEPGTRFDYRGSFLEEDERLQHRVTTIVTDLTKVVDGVENVVVWERDYGAGELVETELALFAQDEDGNVWHMGEYPEEWEGGELVKAPAWVHGLHGATAGITIPATPEVGTRDYAEGYAPPPINWADRGRVHETGQKTCVPAGCYADVVIVEEFERSIKEAFQDKYYAPGVGVVRVGWRGANDDTKEVLELVDVRTLSTAEMDEARADALALEERALRISKDVFGRMPRSQGPGD